MYHIGATKWLEACCYVIPMFERSTNSSTTLGPAIYSEGVRKEKSHTREDTVLMVSHLEGIHLAGNQIVRRLNVVVIGIVFLVIYLL